MIAVVLLPNAIEMLRKEYRHLDKDFEGFRKIRPYLGKVVYTDHLEFQRGYALFNESGARLISGMFIKIVGLPKLKKNLIEFL